MRRNGVIALVVGLLVLAFAPRGLEAGPRHGFHHRGGVHHGGFHHHRFRHHGFHHHGFRHHHFRHHGFRHHGFRGRVVIGGPPYFWGYRPYPYLYTPPPAVVRRPTVYVQQAPATGPLEAGYWYYCQSAGAFYPAVSSCQEAWVKVPPRTE